MSNVVYYIGVTGEDFVKIGTTKNLQARLRSLSTARADGDRLVILATEPGSYDVEQRRHEQFAEARGHGEWFKVTPDLQAHIDMLALRTDPRYIRGYDDGFQVGLADRRVARLLECTTCGDMSVPLRRYEADEEPNDVCAPCQAEEAEERGEVNMIFTFMSHLGIGLTPDGFRTLPAKAQRALARAHEGGGFLMDPEMHRAIQEGSSR